MANVKLGAARSQNRLEAFRGYETDWVFKRILAFTSEKAAEIGECLFVSRRIDETNTESWIKDWAELRLAAYNNSRNCEQKNSQCRLIGGEPCLKSII